MQRRDFLAASALSGAAVAARPLVAKAQAAANSRQLCEWRTYRLKDAAKPAIVDNYLQTAAVPAWQRMGVGPVGVFKEIGDGASPSLHVLLVYPDAAKFAAAREALERDPEYQKNAVEHLAATAQDPVFERIDSWLMVSFEGMPQPAAPAGGAKPTVYELRTYESHNEDRARAKIKMFNDGEIEIFKACGFHPIFFGESLVGANLPHLKYMLASADNQAHDAAWTKFRSHPDWLAMKDKAEYKDTVSKISQLFLTPLPYSQL